LFPWSLPHINASDKDRVNKGGTKIASKWKLKRMETGTLTRMTEEISSPRKLSCTIAIPAYNREEMIRGAIESALAVQRDDIEVYVIDNCSEDRTVEVSKSYNDPRLTVLQNPENLGLFGNFNRCLEVAQSPYLCLLCSDDRIRPGFIERAIEVMEANPDCALLTARAEFIGLDGKPSGPSAYHLDEGVYDGKDLVYDYLWFQNHYAYNVVNLPSGNLMRVSAVRLTAPFRKDWRIVGDIEFFCRLLEHGNLAAIHEVGCDILHHSGQEVFKIYGDASRVHEQYEMIEQYRELLGPAYGRVKLQSGAIATALALKFWRLNDKKAAREHWDIVQSKGFSKPAQFYALMRLAYMRTMYDKFGLKSLPRKPIRGLGV